MDLSQQRELMLSGRMYDDLTPGLVAAREAAVLAAAAYNDSLGHPAQQRLQLLRRLLKHAGRGAHFEPTFRCEFGFNISVGDDFYANFDCVMLDGGGISIGDSVLIGPRTSIFTTNHALDPDERAAGACSARPVRIGDQVWIGGSVVINPGVTIGDGAVIGSGSVVTSDVPPRSVAAGVPARVLREITEKDRTGWRTA